MEAKLMRSQRERSSVLDQGKYSLLSVSKMWTKQSKAGPSLFILT